MSKYLNPRIVNLDDLDFQKLDVSPETALFISADFAIRNAGEISDLAITVDRDNYRYLKSVSAVSLGSSPQPLFKEDVAVSQEDLDASGVFGIAPNGLTQTKQVMSAGIHTPTTTATDTTNVIQGTLFAMMVSRIFDTSSLKVSDIDFSQSLFRSNELFFAYDATEDVPNDIVTKTLSEFSLDASGEDYFYPDPNNPTVLDQEIAYWNTRTGLEAGLETESVPFLAGDKLLIMYSITIQFSKVTSGGDNDASNGTYSETDNALGLDALTNAGTSIAGDSADITTVLNSATADIKFILEFYLNFS